MNNTTNTNEFAWSNCWFGMGNGQSQEFWAYGNDDRLIGQVIQEWDETDDGEEFWAGTWYVMDEEGGEIAQGITLKAGKDMVERMI